MVDATWVRARSRKANKIFGVYKARLTASREPLGAGNSGAFFLLGDSMPSQSDSQRPLKSRLPRQQTVKGGCSGTGDDQREQGSHIKHHHFAVIALRPLAEECEVMHEGPGHKDVAKGEERERPSSREIPFGKLRAGSRPAGEDAGLRDDAGNEANECAPPCILQHIAC
jgi:hypothetical protein